MDKGIQIKVDDKVVLQRLGELQATTANLQPLFKKISSALLGRTQQNIQNEAAPDGTKWPGLKPRTAARRIGTGRRGYDHMLRNRGYLYGSLVSRSDANSATIGTNVIYAAIHNMGGEINMPERQHTIYQRYNERTDTLNPRFVKRSGSNFARDVKIKAHKVKIPAREFLGFAEGDRKTVLAIAAEHFASSAGMEGAAL